MRMLDGIWVAALMGAIGLGSAKADEYVVPQLGPAAKPQATAPAVMKAKTHRTRRTIAARPADPAPVEPTTPEGVWASLREGNVRFISGAPRARASRVRGNVAPTARPRALVLACSDGPWTAGAMFDQPAGAVLSVGTAGPTVDAVTVGSVEQAVEHLGLDVVVVLGHERCAAIAAALARDPGAAPAVAALVGRIRSTIDDPGPCTGAEDCQRRAAEVNARRSADRLVEDAPALHERVQRGTLLIVAAMVSADGAVREIGRVSMLDAAPPRPEPTPVTVAAAIPAPAKAEPIAAAVSPGPRPAVSTPPAAAGAGAPASPIAWDGQLRFRYEYRSVLDYRLPGMFKRPATQALGDAGDVSIMRTRLGANLKLAPNVKGYFCLQDARTMGAEGSPGGTLANVDLFLAYVDLDSVGHQPVSMRVGRQVLTYGDARLVSGADWGNAGRGYDGARLRVQPAHWQMDVFGCWINEGRVEGADRLFSGADLMWRGPAGLELEGYLFARSFGDTGFVAESGRSGKLFDRTTGARARVAYRRLTATAESAMQRGRRAGDEVRAWFAVTRATIELPGTWKPRAFGEFMAGSGDEDPADGVYGRFDPIYWGAPLYQGRLLLANAGNLNDRCGGISFQPHASWTVSSELHDFTLMEAADAWADASGTTLRRDKTGAAGTDLGDELDLMVKWDPRPRLTLLTGYAHLWTGSFVAHTGGGAGVDWGFLQMAVTF